MLANHPNVLGGGGGSGSGGSGTGNVVQATRQTATNNSGDTTLTAIAASVNQHTAVVTVGGSARTSNVALPVTDRTAGDHAHVKFLMPTTAAIILNVRNATAGGTILNTFTSDTSGDDIVCLLEYDGSAWQPCGYNYPSNTV